MFQEGHKDTQAQTDMTDMTGQTDLREIREIREIKATPAAIQYFKSGNLLLK
jgi:hypothetical protein